MMVFIYLKINQFLKLNSILLFDRIVEYYDIMSFV